MNRRTAALRERYAAAPTGKSLIEECGWAACEVCSDAFALKTETRRHCAKCHTAFCPTHGTFTQGFGICIFCGRAQYKEEVRRERVKEIGF